MHGFALKKYLFNTIVHRVRSLEINMKAYILGMFCTVVLVNSVVAMTPQARSSIELEKSKACQLAQGCKIPETFDILKRIGAFKGVINRDEELVSLLQDAVNNVKSSFKEIDERCASWTGNRSALLPLSSQKSLILRNFSDLYADIKDHFKEIHNEKAEAVRQELRGLGFVDI
jgi:hypothetical protein